MGYDQGAWDAISSAKGATARLEEKVERLTEAVCALAVLTEQIIGHQARDKIIMDLLPELKAGKPR